jgi:hypothetical protein
MNGSAALDDAWHTLRVTVEGDVMRVEVDGNPTVQLKSEGVAHPTKRMITLAVNRNAWIDDVRVTKLR